MEHREISQSVHAEHSVVAGITQVARDLNVTNYIFVGADTERLWGRLTRTEERRWQEHYERLRDEANAGYTNAVQEPVDQIIVEIEVFEAEHATVSVELKAKIYRLAAVVYLPHSFGGDADLCARFLEKARELSEGDGLVQCQITQGLLLYETGATETALSILGEQTTDEAVRLRFAIYLETQRFDECLRMVESGVVDPEWCQTNTDWARTFFGYYALTGRRQDAENALALLIAKAPNADSYRVAAQSLVHLGCKKMQAFCLEHDMFPGFHIGLALDELIDGETLSRAADLFARSAELYQEHGCDKDAVRMLTNAIHLAMDSDGRSENLADWARQLESLDPGNPLCVVLRQPEYNKTEMTGEALTILDLSPLLADSSTEPHYILNTATSIADTASRAAEVAAILEKEVERFRATDVGFAEYVFVVLKLWNIGDDEDRALTWLKQSATAFSHPRLEPLFHAWLCSNQGEFETARTWSERALLASSEHPEVLAAAVIAYHQSGDTQGKLTFAQSLFEMLRTSQTANWYLGALLETSNFEILLDVLDDVQDLPIEETLLKRYRARTLIAVGRAKEAQADLEWLRDNNVAEPLNLIDLARVYQLVGDSDYAVATLRGCVERFPDTADAYLLLSHTYLLAGRREECFDWAVRAQQRFPDTPRVLLHLWSVSFPTGNELYPEVSKAFRAFMPGGRFADQSPFVRLSLEEVLEWARPQEGVVMPNVLYRTGQISRMMLCVMRNVPMFLAHCEANTNREVRYVADGGQLQDIAQLKQDRPHQVVLDYSALLTLWSLFDANLLSYLSRHFDQVYLPETMQKILLSEQDRMTAYGQEARYQAQCAVRDALQARIDKTTIHPRVDPERGWDVTGHHTEVTVAEREGWIHLNEHIPPSENPSRVPTVGIAVVADVLYEAGEISLLVAQALKLHARPPTQEETALGVRLQQGCQVIVDLLTLVSWAMHHDLVPILDYLGHVHVAEPARERLLSDIRGYEFLQQTLESLRSLRRLLLQGEEDGLVVFGTIPDEERIIRRLVEERRRSEQTPGDSESSERPMLGHVDDYLDELLGIACREDIPVWTDDRWTKALRLDGRQPRYYFGTDAFLAFANQCPEIVEPLGTEEYHTYYDQLVAWRYCFLPINVDHILWHLQKGRNTGSRALESLLRHYRDTLVEFWDLSDSVEGIDEKLGVRVLSFFDRQLADTLRKLHEHDIPIDVSADIFAALDLSRHGAPRVLGRESLFLVLLLLHAITTAPNSSAVNTTIQGPSDQNLDYLHWLNKVILRSGVAHELVEEAWYQLVCYFLAMLDQAQTDSDRAVHLLFLERTFCAMPVPIVDYLLSTDIGPLLREEFGLRLHESFFFRVEDEEGRPLKVRYPADEWNRDLERAMSTYLEAPTEEPISTGLATIKAELVNPGSVFLKAEVIPTEIWKQYPDMRLPTQYYCILSGFLSPEASRRAALWQIGLDVLQRYQIPTTEWASCRENLLSVGGEGVQAGLRARRQLLGNRQVAREYLAQAAQIGPPMVLALLRAIEPTTVRGWLSIPAGLDWSCADDLMNWAEQLSIGAIDPQEQTNLIEFLDQLGRSIFPDSPHVRRAALSALGSLGSVIEQRKAVEALLVFLQSQSSLALKANSAILFLHWLLQPSSFHEATKDEIDQAGEHILALVVEVLQSTAGDAATEAAMPPLEAIICQWLYHSWPPSSLDARLLELAYLAQVGASHIADALISEGRIGEDTARKAIAVLRNDLQQDMMSSGIEPQPDGLFCPAWCGSLNYAASHLLKGLLDDEMPALRCRDFPAVKAAALGCGSMHRHLQVVCSSMSLRPSWMDTELMADVGTACAMILGVPDEAELEAWAEEDRHRLLMSASPEAATVLREATLSALPNLEDEEDVMYRVLWLFQGRIRPCPEWFQALQYMFSAEVLETLRQFTACYGEVIWRSGEMLLHAEEDWPSDVMESMLKLVFEIPLGENAPSLIEMKANTLSQLVGFGLDVEKTSRWLEDLVKSTELTTASVRAALRPFILHWPDYPEDIQKPLYDTLSSIAAMPIYGNLWEFARLERHKRVVGMADSGSKNRNRP